MSARVRTPSFKMQLGNIDFEGELSKMVISIEVESMADAASSFTVTLDDGEDQFANGGKIKEGDRAVISMGYVGEESKLIEGTITGVKSFRREQGRKVFSVTGFDDLQALTRGRKRRSWEQMKDSDLAKILASEAGLGCEADDSEIIHPYIAQNNVTNLDMLYERARRIGFEVRVENKIVMFKKPQIKESCASLAWNRQGGGNDLTILRRCNINTSTMGVVDKVVVRSYDPKTKKEIIASSDDVHGGAMSGARTASEYAAASNPSTTIQISDTPVASQEEAEKLAWSVFNQRAGNFGGGMGSSEGNPDIMAGKIINLSQIGAEMDGDYYVTRSVHKLLVGNGPGYGYTTDFEVRRSGR